MAWILIISSVIAVWIASFCQIFCSSRSSSKSTFLNNGGSPQRRNVLLVIAHPDDESMFFSPTINHLTSKGHNLHVLCLSIGNADGLGNVRKEELYQACAVLKVSLQQVKVLDHPDFQDGFGKVWNHDLLANVIEDEVKENSINYIITFDNYGVSGHCNHRDVHYSVLKFVRDTALENIEAWELVSTNIFRKYSGPVDIWWSMLQTKIYSGRDVTCLLNESPRISFLAMAQHASQWVWFRKLFVSLSSYTYVNVLRKIQ